MVIRESQPQWSAQHRTIRSWAYAYLSSYGIDCGQYSFFVYIDIEKKTARVEAHQKYSNRMILIDRIEYNIPMKDGDWDSALPKLMYRTEGEQ